MGASFKNLIGELKTISRQFDKVALKQKMRLLRQLSSSEIPRSKAIEEYADILLYCHAYPSSRTFLQLVSRELSRTARTLQKFAGANARFVNTGLPYTETVATFAHALLQWMALQDNYDIRLESFGDDGIPLSDALRLTLPALEKHLTSAGYSNDELFEALGIPESEKLQFLLTEIGKLDSADVLDHIFERLCVFVAITPKNKIFSKAFNRLNSVPPFYHDSLLKHFDDRALFNTALPSPMDLDSDEASHVTNVIRHSLALLQRETDPATHLDVRSLRLYHLERGVSIALYTMTPERQLPIESYVGYTLFKNGYPTAYGGAWVLGKYAIFGINVHDAYRGGESGFLLCQLLRTYRQVFHVDYFEVEPYQYGKDNPEGIASGAYWFYYHYGFRSLDDKLRKLAEREYSRIKRQPGYRTPNRTLEKFTESNCALNLGRTTPPSMYDFLEKISAMITSRYGGDRTRAVKEGVQKFKKRTGMEFDHDADQEKVLIDIALLHEALQVRSSKKRQLMVKMIGARSVDLYRYQECLREFLGGTHP